MDTRDNVLSFVQNNGALESRPDADTGPNAGPPVEPNPTSRVEESEDDESCGDENSDESDEADLSDDDDDDDDDDEAIDGVPYIAPNDTWAAAQVLQNNQSLGPEWDPTAPRDDLMFEDLFPPRRRRGRPQGRSGYSNLAQKPRRTYGRGVERALRSKDKFKRDVFGVGKRGGPGRRGTHATADPGHRFKQLQMKSMDAFFRKEYDLAAGLATQAIEANPEMFVAHSLLSQIYFKMGKTHESLVTLWAGAHPRREKDNWKEVAQRTVEIRGDRSDDTLNQVLYCWSRVIVIDRSDLDARRARLEIYLEQDRWHNACKECAHILRLKPDDLECLHKYAELCMKLDKARDGRDAFAKTFAHYKGTDPFARTGEVSFVDLNVYLDLICSVGEWDEGLEVLKKNARWICGRKNETFWDNFSDNDCEWDLEHHPRRTKIRGFKSGQFSIEQYGDGLPLEIRAKLGIFRLRSSSRNVKEAFRHFAFFEPRKNNAEQLALDYFEVLRDVGDAFFDNEYYREALLYYEPLLIVQSRLTASVTRRISIAHRHVGNFRTAIVYLTTLASREVNDVEAMLEIAKVYELTGDDELKKELVDRILKLGRGKLVKNSGLNLEKLDIQDPQLLEQDRPKKKYRKVPADAARNKRIQQQRLRDQDLSSGNERLKALTNAQRRGDPDAVEEWTSIATSMTDTFRKKKVRFPSERHMSNLDLAIPIKDPVIRPEAGEPGAGRVSFSDWFHIFCKLALVRAKSGNAEEAFQPLRTLLQLHIDRQNRVCLQHIRHVEMACALILNDEQHLAEVGRWFVREYPHASDTYHLFSILSRLYSGPQEHFIGSSSHSTMIRAMKIKDWPFIPKDAVQDFKLAEYERSTFEAHHAGTKDLQGAAVPGARFPNAHDNNSNDPFALASDSPTNINNVTSLEPSIFLITSHIYNSNSSSLQTLHYLLRAYAASPGHASTSLSIAVTYVHIAMKRKTEARHFHLAQAVAWLGKYRKARLGRDLKRKRGPNAKAVLKMEVLYNEGRFWHSIGLTHLALGCYERCLNVGEGEGDGADAEGDGDGDMNTGLGGVARGEDPSFSSSSDISFADDKEQKQQQGETGAATPPAGSDLPPAAIPSFKRTVAYSLRHILALGGDVRAASTLTDRHLVF